MLKITYAIGILILTYNVYAVAQEMSFDKRAIYRLSYCGDTTNVESFHSLDMELLLNDEMSIFQTLKQRQEDSILYFHDTVAANELSKVGGILLRPVNKFKYKILKTNIGVQVFDSAFGMGLNGKEIIYEYEENSEGMAWQIKEDTLRYGPYICQRADLTFGGRKWIAWFTMEIPINDGPYKFMGLPGLIVKIHDEREWWNFDLLRLEVVDIKHAINFQKWYVIQGKTKEELYKDRYDFQQNMPALYENSTPEDGDLEKHKLSQIITRKMIRGDNNWIEIYNRK